MKSRRDRVTLNEQDDNGEETTDDKIKVPKDVEDSSPPQTRSDDHSNTSDSHVHETEIESVPVHDSSKTKEKDTAVSDHGEHDDHSGYEGHDEHEVKSVSLSAPSDFQSASQQVNASPVAEMHSESSPVEILFPQHDYGRSPIIDTGDQLELHAEISSMNQPDHNIDVNQLANHDVDEDVYHMGSVDYDDYRSKYVDGDQSAKSYNHGNKDGYKSGSKIKQIVSSMENSSTTLHKISAQAPKDTPVQPTQETSNKPQTDEQSPDESPNNNLLQRSNQSLIQRIKYLLCLTILVIAI